MRQQSLTVLIFIFCETLFAGHIDVTPKPGMVKPGTGFFILNGDTRILYEKGCDNEAARLISYLEPATGYDIRSQSVMTEAANTITLKIDKYPKLTEKGGFRGKDANRYGGYYTKDEIRDMVKYAAQLHIEIIPEIELPAHCQSALAAYPWLGCNDKQFEVPTKSNATAGRIAAIVIKN